MIVAMEQGPNSNSFKNVPAIFEENSESDDIESKKWH